MEIKQQSNATSVQIFNNSQFGQMRTSTSASNEPLFCLADVCKALDLGNPSQVKQRLQRNGVISNEVIDSMNRVQQMNFITEPNLYRCIFQSRKKEAEQFQDWVCDEVLPAIRKSGGYMTSQRYETPEQIMARALVIAQDTITRQQGAMKAAESKAYLLECQNKVLSETSEAKDRTIKYLQPGATFAHAVKTSECSILVGDLARIIKQNGVEIGQNRLFAWLRERGYLIRRSGESYNMPTQQSLSLGLFEIKKTVITKPDGTSLVTTTPKVTGKGQVYFVNKFLYIEENRRGAEIQARIEAEREGGAK